MTAHAEFEPAAAPIPAFDRTLLTITDWTAGILLAADLAVVIVSVVLRSVFHAPVEWSDDVARGLMVGSSFFGAASALARGENAGVVFFIQKARPDAAAHRRFGRRAAGLHRRGLRRLQRHPSRHSHHRADDRLRPPARMDVLPDGRGGGVHGAVRTLADAAARPTRYRDRGSHHGGDRGPLVRMERIVARHRAGRGRADGGRVRAGAVRRPADRFCAGAGGADLHLDRRRAARRHLRAADGARHRQLRPAGDPVLHPGRLPDGEQRHVGAPHRAAAAHGRQPARRAQCRHGARHDGVLRHFRLEDGGRRGRRLGAGAGGAALRPKPGRLRGAARSLGRDGGSDPALHQPHHPGLRRQHLDRRPVHGRASCRPH